jgi:hypothetical protein
MSTAALSESLKNKRVEQAKNKRVEQAFKACVKPKPSDAGLSP